MNGFGPLHLRRLREHPGRAALSVGGVAVGIALMVAMLGLFSAMTSAADRLADLAGNATLEVSAPNDGGLPEPLIDEIAAVPGVQAVAPLLRSQVVVAREAALMLGLDSRALALGPSAGLGACMPRPLPTRAGVIAGPAITASSVAVTSPGGTVSADVVARLTCSAARNVNAGRFLIAPLPLAQQLAGKPGRVDAVEIIAKPGTSSPALAAAVDDVVAGRGVVASPRLIARQARTNARAFQQGAGLMVGLAMVVGGFCVFNTVSMTALERRRELATLRAIGGSRRRLLLGFLSEMSLLGVIGSATGAALGAVAGSRLIGGIPNVLIDEIGVRPTFVLQPNIVVMALLLGTGVTIAAASLPARSAVRVAPVEAMRPEAPAESASTRPATNVAALLVGAVAFVGGTYASLRATHAATLVGFAAITAGALLITYAARGQAANAAAGVASCFGNSGRLAAASISRAPRRTWATITAVAIAVGTVISIGGVVVNQITTFTAQFRSMADSDVWIGTSAVEDIPVNLRLPDSTLAAIGALPSVESVVGSQAAYTTIGKDRVLLEGFSGRSNAPVFAAMTPDHQHQLLSTTRNYAVINRAYSELHTIGPGDAVHVVTGSGPLSLRVLEVVDVVSPNPTGLIGVRLSLLERAYGRTGVNFIEVQARPNVTPAALKATLQTLFADSPTPVVVATGAEEFAGVKRSLTQTTAIFQAMQAAVLLATALAFGNALLISVVERRRELGIVRAVGTSRRQLRRSVVLESIAIAVVGTGVGIALGLVQHVVGDRATEGLLQAKVHYAFTFRPLVTALIATSAMAVVAALLPAARAANVNVIEAIGYE